jgi:hypothetical protein
MEVLLNLFPQRVGAGVVPHSGHHEPEHFVSCRPRNRQMELVVSGLVRGLVVDVLAHRAQRGEDLVEVRILAFGRSAAIPLSITARARSVSIGPSPRGSSNVTDCASGASAT